MKHSLEIYSNREIHEDDNNTYKDENTSVEELRSKLNEYATFVDTHLHPALKDAVSRRQETEDEIEEYEELKSNLMILQKRVEDDENDQGSRLETMVDLGHKTMYCRAIVSDYRRVFVHVGLGFHAEFSLEEAASFVDRRVDHLRRNVLAKRVDRARTVASDLEGVLVVLEALSAQVRELKETK